MTEPRRLRIVVPSDDPPQIAPSPQLERLRPYGELVLHRERPRSRAEQIERTIDADVIINSRSAVTWPAEVLQALPRLKMITTCGIGTDAIDLVAARERSILVSNIPGKTAPVVAEHALALLLAAARRLAFQTAELKAGRWTLRESIFLAGKTVGVVGTGTIGSAFARLARAIGMKVVAWTYHPSPERAEALAVPFVELDELLRTSDAVSLHLRLTPESRGLIGARELELMKAGSLLVNTARGALVDMNALAAVLHSGHLAGAALDVFDIEPLPPDHPILACEQVVLTPHIADQTPEGIDFLNAGAVDNVIAFLDGAPQNVVT
jgi:phosphoglycerate dehydrogenase-like enzyme